MKHKLYATIKNIVTCATYFFSGLPWLVSYKMKIHTALNAGLLWLISLAWAYVQQKHNKFLEYGQSSVQTVT